jgi:hypothetical protein
MSTRNLIDAIEAGEASNIEASFNDIMANKVSERIDSMRDVMAQNMFTDPEMESEEELTDEELADEELALEGYSLEELEEFMMSEEVEELDETTRKQVKDFHDVLSKEVEAHSLKRKASADSGNRRKFNAAHDAITKHGIAATNYARKYNKEEVEELDELSKTTLGNYVKTAKGSLIGGAQVMGMGNKMTGQKTQDKAETQVRKRASGINKAVDRLTK